MTIIEQIARKAHKIPFVRNRMYPEREILVEDLTKVQHEVDLPSILTLEGNELTKAIADVRRRAYA